MITLWTYSKVKQHLIKYDCVKVVDIKSSYSLGSLGGGIKTQIPGPYHSQTQFEYLGVEPRAHRIGYCEERRREMLY